jgi:anti-sigma regulatory factor (Ser/Thr protein kinase)
MGGGSGGTAIAEQRVDQLITMSATEQPTADPVGRRAMLQHSDRPPDQRGHAATWVLPGHGEAVAQARDHVREFLTAYDQAVTPATLRDSLLVVSELVTNAVLHAPGLCVLHVDYHDDMLAIAVSDTSSALPVPRVPDPATADGGFGWHLLTSLTSSIDVQPRSDGGKTVTAVLRAGRVP